jgi:hypothetical protein
MYHFKIDFNLMRLVKSKAIEIISFKYIYIYIYITLFEKIRVENRKQLINIIKTHIQLRGFEFKFG